MQLRLADAIAGLAWRVLPAMHGRVRDNVRHILGEQAPAGEVERIARAQWRNYVRYMRDFAALPFAAEAEIGRIMRAAEGWAHIEQAMAEGKGLVLVSAHFGNWDLAAGTMARHYPVHVIADTFSSARVDALINDRRHALGLQVIPIEKALKRTLSTLRKGDSVAFLVDKPVPGDEGVAVQFFGQTVRIPAGAAYFAKRAGARLITAFVWRQADGNLTARVLPPVPVDADLQVTMQRVIQLVENMVRQAPEHWYMFRSMWGARPHTQDRGARVADSGASAERLEEAVA